MRIAIFDDYQNAVRGLDAFAKLDGHEVVVFHDTPADPAELRRRLEGIDALVLTMQRTSLPGEVIAGSSLRLICQTGRNTSHIDVAAATASGVAIALTGTGSPKTVVELTWALILASRRNIPQEAAALRAGRWQTTLGHSLDGKTLGIYAFGRLGSLVAGVGRAFGMRVVCWGREGSSARAREAGYEVAADREAFFAGADVLSLHIPLNAATRGIVTAADLALMKPDALLVNTSRAQIVAPGALAQAVRHGRPGFAAVDVYDEEPTTSDPLMHMANVVASPHLGGVVRGGYEDFFGKAFDIVAAFGRGEAIEVANPDALTAAGAARQSGNR